LTDVTLDGSDTVARLVDLAAGGAHGGAAAMLSPRERRRAASFRFPERQREFVLCRAAVRSLLSRQMGVAPRDVPIEEGSFGRPRVSTGGWDFNISHSGTVGLVAVRFGGRVGVDVQGMPPGFPWRRVMARICRGRELAVLGEDAQAIGDRAFLERWAAKEALLKALGAGFSIDPARIECRRSQHGHLRAWEGADLLGEIVSVAAPPGFAAAIAVLDATRRPAGAR
jgi:4'-phosphopantetheinyl transferase